MTLENRPQVQWNEFAASDELAEALAARIVAALGDAIAERGRATLAVSGGRTPKHLFNAISRHPFDWKNVSVVLVDERLVAPDSDRSNERLVRDNLLIGEAAQAHFVPLFSPGMSAEEAALAADKKVRALGDPLDVVVLGMGPDGHTASFFPDAPALRSLYDNADDKAVLPVHAESAGEPRLTLSMQLLTSARLLVVHIESDERRRILTEALDEGELPIARFLAEAKAVPQIFWAAG